MPTAAITIGTLVARVHTRLWGIGSVDTNIRTEILFALDNTFQDIMGEVDLADFRSTFTIQTTAGTSVYPLPEDFRAIVQDSMRYAEAPHLPLRHFDESEFDEAGMHRHFRSNARPRLWTYTGKDSDNGVAQLTLLPPADKSYSLQGRYYIIGQDISTAADADVLDRRFPRELLAALYDGCLLFGLENFANAESVQIAAQLYKRHLRKARRLAKRRVGVKAQQRQYRGMHRGRGGRHRYPTDFTIDGSGVDFGSAP